MQPKQQLDSVEEANLSLEQYKKKSKRKLTEAEFNENDANSECDDKEDGSSGNSSKKKLSLDQYLASHTSEDNESFKEIQKESIVRHKMKYSWLYQDENELNRSVEEKLKVPSIEQQALGLEKPLAIDTWSYKNQNHCMYVPDGKYIF